MKLTVVMLEQAFFPEWEDFDNINTVLCEKRESLFSCLQSLSAEDGWVTVMHVNDCVTADYWSRVAEFIERHKQIDILFSQKKYFKSKMKVPFSVKENTASGCLSKEDLQVLHSFFMEGTVLRTDKLAALGKYQAYGRFALMAFLIQLQQEAKEGTVGYLSEEVYEVAASYEGDKTFFPGVYQKDWYQELTGQFCLPLLQEMKRRQGNIDLIWQYQMAFLVNYCIEANLNNVNKHLFEQEEAEEILWCLGEILSYVEPAVLLDRHGFKIAGKNDNLRRWVYLILKYRDRQLEYDFVQEGKDYFYSYAGCKGGLLEEATVDIQSMTYQDGVLSIDGRVSPMVYMNGIRFYLKAGKKQIEVEKKERYAHTKAFGMSIYKLQAFHVEVPLVSGKNTELAFMMEGSWGSMPVSLEFDSHFSRLTNRFRHSYWRMDKKTMMSARKAELKISSASTLSVWGREVMLWLDMLKTGEKKIIKYIPVRLFLLMKPLLKRKPIWLFIDKIYKAGDSSEYLYHYVKENDTDVCAYYLLDKNCPDYKRMISEGDKPLIRHSLAHRRAFLYADWVIISNSTVFAFNDFSTKNSAYIRDLVHFHVACVQHGMSVQKIAVAQNRLRDNIELYFCASKYEIDNLSKPIYDYDGYDCLKLTGVPRYDGLINRDKKQILISPTWRMQAAVPVTKNESVIRDYNPLFKETTYYQVYNSLINDKRLLEAAKKYGYRIVYVLHPIVSAQVDDFDKNEAVEIIPAAGEMSYEKIFCESSLMVTDFSGVQFDFAYMRKPVLYLHHRDIPQHYEEGTYHYDTMAFGEICHDNEELIDALCEYMANDCQMKEEYRKRADDFFAFSDHNNCERIYQVMKERRKTEKK